MSIVIYRFGDPLSLNLHEFGNPCVDLGTSQSIAINGCITIEYPMGIKSVGNRKSYPSAGDASLLISGP